MHPIRAPSLAICSYFRFISSISFLPSHCLGPVCPLRALACRSHAGAKAAAAAVAANGYRVPEVPVAAHRQLAAESNTPAGRLPPIARCVEAGTHEAKTNAPVEPEFLLPVPMKSLCVGVGGGATRGSLTLCSPLVVS